MYAKLFIVLALAAVALCREYPAGVHPAVCPNYPYCDTAALARHTPDGQPIPEWVYNPSVLPVAPVDPNNRPAAAQLRFTPDGQPIPEWVYNPSILPVAPVDPNNRPAAAQLRFTPDGQPIPEWVYNPSILPVAPVDPNHNAAPRYPADFNPALCPNYPYCW